MELGKKMAIFDWECGQNSAPGPLRKAENPLKKLVTNDNKSKKNYPACKELKDTFVLLVARICIF